MENQCFVITFFISKFLNFKNDFVFTDIDVIYYIYICGEIKTNRGL